MSTSDTIDVVNAILTRLMLDPDAPDVTPVERTDSLWVVLKTMHEAGQPVLYPIRSILEHLELLGRQITLRDIRIVVRFHTDGYEALIPLLWQAREELGPTAPTSAP